MAAVPPLGLALGAAATFGLSTSLQHLASSRLGGSSTVGLMASLVRTPLWSAGMGLSVVAFVGLDPDVGLWGLVSGCPVRLLLACGSCAALVNQRAYQTVRLSVSMPILDIVDVLVALVLAGVIFGEMPSWSPPALAPEVLGLTAVGGGGP